MSPAGVNQHYASGGVMEYMEVHTEWPLESNQEEWSSMNSLFNLDHIATDLLLKALKAANRYQAQYVLCYEMASGTCTRFHSTKEEELMILKKRKKWAMHQILAFHKEVNILSRFYDLKRTAEVKEMIFDFLETVDKFCYETELAEVA